MQHIIEYDGHPRRDVDDAIADFARANDLDAPDTGFDFTTGKRDLVVRDTTPKQAEGLSVLIQGFDLDVTMRTTEP